MVFCAKVALDPGPEVEDACEHVAHAVAETAARPLLGKELAVRLDRIAAVKRADQAVQADADVVEIVEQHVRLT